MIGIAWALWTTSSSSGTLFSYAKSHGIPVGPGRGSAAGQHRLLLRSASRTSTPSSTSLYFERFLEPRARLHAGYRHGLLRAPPRRGHRLRYAANTARTTSRRSSPSAPWPRARPSATSGRALNISYAETDARRQAGAASATRHDAGRSAEALQAAAGHVRERREACTNLIDTAKALEGMPRHASTHAAGRRHHRAAGVRVRPARDATTSSIVTQYTMTTLEELGLLKMDFLGLRNLTVLEDAAQTRPAQASAGFLTSTPCPMDDPGDLRHALRGQDGRRVPARDRRA